jgi:hypothetical protein
MNDEPVSYGAAQAGEIIGQTACWMKTQARAGKIPHTRVGRQMRWTPQHLSEILRAGEQRPKPVLAPVPARRQPAAKDGTQLLQAKTPRRRRSAA